MNAKPLNPQTPDPRNEYENDNMIIPEEENNNSRGNIGQKIGLAAAGAAVGGAAIYAAGHISDIANGDDDEKTDDAENSSAVADAAATQANHTAAATAATATPAAAAAGNDNEKKENAENINKDTPHNEGDTSNDRPTPGTTTDKPGAKENESSNTDSGKGGGSAAETDQHREDGQTQPFIPSPEPDDPNDIPEIAAQEIDPNDYDGQAFVRYADVAKVYTVDGNEETVAVAVTPGGEELVMVDVDGDEVFDEIRDNQNEVVSYETGGFTVGDAQVDIAHSSGDIAYIEPEENISDELPGGENFMDDIVDA